ncbi:MAG: hypothetical protein ACOYJ1_05180 [Peptococcales bacterium]|jgi:hypothetical protein
MYYDRNEVQAFVVGMQEGKTYAEILDELYPKTEYECVYECAIENMRSFSLIETFINALTKREQPVLQPCNCLCEDC